MADLLIAERDLARLAVQKSGTNLFKTSPIQVRVTVPKDKTVEKAVKEDPLLQQQMADAANQELDRIANGLGQELKNLAAQYEKFPQHRTQITADVNKRVQRVGDDARKVMEIVVKEVWDKFARVKRDYRNYRIKAGIKITLNASWLITSATLAGVGGWTGAGSIIGIIGMLKTASALVQQIIALAKDAEKVTIELAQTLRRVAESYRNQTSRMAAAKELLKKAVGQVLSYELESISKCVNLSSLLKSKLDGVEVTSHQLARELNGILQKSDQASAALTEYVRKLESRTRSTALDDARKQADKLEKTLTKLETLTADKIQACMKTVQQVQDGRVKHGLLQQQVTLLDNKVPQWSKVIQMGMPLLDGAWSASWGDVAVNFSHIAADLATSTDTFDKAMDKALKVLS